VVVPNANSRFFTDCYHRPPQSRQGLGGRRGSGAFCTVCRVSRSSRARPSSAPGA